MNEISEQRLRSHVQRSYKEQPEAFRWISLVSWEMLLTPELLYSVWAGCRHSLPLMSDQEKLQLITLPKAPSFLS